MRYKEIIIQNKDSLSISDVESNIQKLVIRWGKNNPVVNDLISSEIDSFVHKVTIKCPSLEVLDVSKLEDVKFFNIDVRHLKELYLPAEEGFSAGN